MGVVVVVFLLYIFVICDKRRSDLKHGRLSEEDMKALGIKPKEHVHKKNITMKI